MYHFYEPVIDETRHKLDQIRNYKKFLQVQGSKLKQVRDRLEHRNYQKRNLTQIESSVKNICALIVKKPVKLRFTPISDYAKFIGKRILQVREYFMIYFWEQVVKQIQVDKSTTGLMTLKIQAYRALLQEHFLLKPIKIRKQTATTLTSRKQGLQEDEEVLLEMFIKDNYIKFPLFERFFTV